MSFYGPKRSYKQWRVGDCFVDEFKKFQIGEFQMPRDDIERFCLLMVHNYDKGPDYSMRKIDCFNVSPTIEGLMEPHYMNCEKITLQEFLKGLV